MAAPSADSQISPEGTRRLRCGVFGTGALGRHHARILSDLPEAELVGIFDTDAEVAEAIATQHGVRAFERHEDLAASIEAAVVAVPTIYHREVGLDLLARGVHVMMEKPIAATLEQADELISAAEGKVLAVGHVEFHNPAVQALLAAVRASGVAPGYVEIQRLSVFTPRSLDIDVVLDLMIHDLQILHALTESHVVDVRATGIEVLSPKIDLANARLEFANGCVANVTASRVSGEKVRKLRVISPSRYLSLDYMDQEIKGFRLDNSSDADEAERKILPDPVPVERDEPLRAELAAFLAACRGEPAAIVDGRSGRQALETALAVVSAIGETTEGVSSP